MRVRFQRCNHLYSTQLLRCWIAAKARLSLFFIHYRRDVALVSFNSAFIATDSMLHPCTNGSEEAGKIGEVGPPASGHSCFTLPYSRRWHSTGILPCGACGGRSSWGAP